MKKIAKTVKIKKVAKKAVTKKVSSVSSDRGAYWANRKREKNEDKADIGALPPVADPERRKRGEADFDLCPFIPDWTTTPGDLAKSKRLRQIGRLEF